MQIVIKRGKDIKVGDVVLNTFGHLLTPVKVFSINKSNEESYPIVYKRLDELDNCQEHSYLSKEEMVVCVEPYIGS